MMKQLAFLCLLFLATPTQAQTISADRPGTGSDSQVVDLHTLQVEVGNDSKEIRYGIMPNTEISWQDNQFAIKHTLLKTDKNELAGKLSIDTNGNYSIELPFQHTMSSKLSIGTDIIYTRNQPVTEVIEVNYNLTKTLTLTNDLYHDDHIRYGVFLAFVPKNHTNMQFDIGYDQHKVLIGYSINFGRH